MWMSKKTIIGASIGSCVHVAGVAHFLGLAEEQGYRTIFAGPAVGVDTVLTLVKLHRPDMVSLGYRLTPANVAPVLQELIEKSKSLPYQPTWVFGGTMPVAREVAKLGFFDKIFDGAEDLDDCIAYLRGAGRTENVETYEQSLTARIRQKHPYPLIRHHFGLPSYEQTATGIKEIAESRALDVISVGIDQNTQQFFFRPLQRNQALDGAGGVPVKNAEEFRRLKEASLCGNFPLMRCYSGTEDVLQMAGLLHETIDNAWCAVPLFWYNELDGRGGRSLETSMTDAHGLIRWHAERGIPVELNEPHHWGLRDAHDTVSVAASYLCAYHAKKLGVRDYISQYMFNIPNGISFAMDLAKVLAQIEMTESLHGGGFTSYRQTRTGLTLLSGDLTVAKGQLAASTMLQMSVKPDIIHVVGYSEAEHAATPDVIIESVKIARGVIRSTLKGSPDNAACPAIQARKQELLREAWHLLNFIKEFYKSESEDPLFDPAVLADAVRRGIMDAPHIMKNKKFRGILNTRVIDGKCVAYNTEKGTSLSEEERLEALGAAGLLEKHQGRSASYA
jgi:hypothetical protein